MTMYNLHDCFTADTVFEQMRVINLLSSIILLMTIRVLKFLHA